MAIYKGDMREGSIFDLVREHDQRAILAGEKDPTIYVALKIKLTTKGFIGFGMDDTIEKAIQNAKDFKLEE